MNSKEVKTYVGIVIEESIISDYGLILGREFSSDQLEYLRKYISGEHPLEIEKQMGLPPKEQAKLKKEVRELLMAGNDFEMVKRAFKHNVIPKEEYMDISIKEIALKKISDAISGGKIQGLEGLELFANIYELLLSFYHEIEYEQLLLKIDAKS